MRIEVPVPDGKSGNWVVDTFTISEEQAKIHNLGCMMNGRMSRVVSPGVYKRLWCQGLGTIMSNTPAEIRDHRTFFSRVKQFGGDILINGLGLGMALWEVLKNENVTSVTVIEISPDVIALIQPTYSHDKRVTIIKADALTWKAPKGKRYSVVWHDIWATISADNLKTMGTLHRKYGRRCDWQSSWCRREAQSLR